MFAFKLIPRTLVMVALSIFTAGAVHAQQCTIATPCVLSPGVVGTPYSDEVFVVGGVPPYTNFSITSGSLPPGINMTGSADGVVNFSGTPTTSVGSPFVFVITWLDSQGDPITPGEISITITGAAGPPTLTVVPSYLSFATEAGSTTALQQSLLVQDGGGGSVAFTASVAGGSKWVTISPTSGAATAAAPVAITVTASAQGLAVGSYHDVIQVTSASGSASIPVTLFASGQGPILGVGASGVYFGTVQGFGSSLTQTIPVVDTGTGTVNWSVSTPPVSTGSQFITLGSLSGQATPGSPGELTVTLSPTVTSLAPGSYYQLLELSDNNSLNSPQYITAVLHVVAATGDPAPPPPPPPVLSPGGLVFIGPAGQNIPSQQFTVNVSQTEFQDYATSPSLPAGLKSPWMILSPTSGAASVGTPATITVSVKTTGLAAGIYKGLAEVTFNQGTYSVNVTMILTGSGSSAAAVGKSPAHLAAKRDPAPDVSTGAARPAANANGCMPSTLVLTETGLANSFSVPAGWPSNLIVNLNDDCGDAIGNGAVSASFSNGDPPLSLVSQGASGQYSATWQPQNSAANAIVTLLGTVSGLNAATAQISGAVSANSAPILTPHGILHNLDPVVGGALAPGTWAQVYGSNLSAFTGLTTSAAPIPTAFQSNQLVVGGRLAPLYYLSSGQWVAQIPAELTPGQQFSAVAISNNALTLPISVDVVSLVPGVDENFTTGALVAQHNADYSLVTAANPALQGEALIMYLEGMGATNPPVFSGNPAPSTLAPTTVQPTVTVGNQNAHIYYAGLSPGLVGVYQISFQVPTGATGTLNVAITQGTAAAQTTTLPVAP